ncbi:MAG: thioesterase family protein [Desulfobacteraceae bacterium]|nr:thioesterase family protein [Desulfobacteraceae bacterium]
MHLFDQDMSLTKKSPDVFEATISKNWSINGNPNGGYLLSILVNALLQSSHKKSVVITTATYLAKTMPGKAEIFIENIARSNHFDRWQARLVQDGKEKIRAFGTFSDHQDDPAENRYEKSAPDPAPKENCIQIPPMAEMYFSLSFY